MNNYETFRRLMFEKDVRIADVIRGTGVTRQTFLNWKTGKCTPTTSTLKKVANYFGVPVSTLLDE